jgi:hypothetical protein
LVLAWIAPRAQQPVAQVTVPLIVEVNRPFVNVTFTRADGSTRTARMLLDTGGGGFLIVESLARDIGLTLGATSREEGQTFADVKAAPSVSIGGFPLALKTDRTYVIVGKNNVLPPAAQASAEGLIPGHVLAQYHVVFDYPAGTLTVAKPGSLTPVGEAIPMPVGRQSGFPRVELAIAGETHGLLLDTGASFTMVSEVLLKAWGRDHADWERHSGAFGEAATLGGMTLETMFLPGAQWGAYQLPRFGVVSQREGTFERYMTGMMARPIVGSLAGNVLKQFRVELDYAHEMLYLSRPR